NEPEKRANKISNATRLWLGIPLFMLALMAVSSIFNFGNDNLLDLVRRGRVEAVKRTLEKGANPNEKRFGGTTALMYAAQSGQVEIIKALLAKGAKIKQQDDDGDDALIYAAIDDRGEAVKELINAGANINLQNKTGNTALISAASRGRINA